ncbi:serine/threonine protein phosphatase [Paenibacillus chitinolyticus]|uniref:serine/threonine protein phosphatase n=1 Tax=Paenibacillus chitinolyticus TaxID=79263 RepID=UPI002DBE8EE4|nr:serine/threonine protein phosphatase [Paenibacillus chitinolyticus]MEC0245981.1 serine/threonine protein phosphatase [Paenibacillus chitinolyticus]
MRKENSDFKTGFVTEAGTFVQNRDYFAFVELEDMACWVLADGLDSDSEVNSAEMVVRSILSRFLNKPALSAARLKRYMQEASEWLNEESRRVRLKASVLIVVTDYTRIVWAVAGSARLYVIRGGRLVERSRDQSLAQSWADEERIPLEAVDRHEERHNLLNYAGKPDVFEPYVSPKFMLEDGDVLLMSTPGMWENVASAEMVDAVEEAKGPAELTDLLEEVLLSRQKRMVPNYTAAAVYVNKVYKEVKGKKRKWAKRIALILIPLLLVGGGAYVYMAKEAARKAEAAQGMLEHGKSGDDYAAEGDYAKALKEYSEARSDSQKIKDKVHTVLFTKKQRAAQYIVDGDTFLKEGDYDKAAVSFTKAQSEIKNQADFNPQHLEERIGRVQAYSAVMNTVKEGDQKFSALDYIGALEIYQKAKQASAEASFPDGDKLIKGKLDETQEKIAGLEKETKLLEADKLDKKGDRSMAAQDYAGAIAAFASAQEIYQEIKMLERVLGMERKITKAEEKQNPVPAAPPPAPAAQGGQALPGQGSGDHPSGPNQPAQPQTPPSAGGQSSPSSAGAPGSPAGGEGQSRPVKGEGGNSPA